jgi:nicotinamide mononucleotide transporter
MQLLFFATCYLIIFVALTFLKKNFAKDTIPFADAFASAAAFTAMYLMTKKKIENWQWWILTNIASIPLYYIKNYVLTSVYYFILLVIAIAGWAEWRKKII